MKNKLKDIDEKITFLMIDSYHPEDNAYNTGLAHAILVMNGGDAAAIKKTRDARRQQALSK
jgi:hypothetical protein